MHLPELVFHKPFMTVFTELDLFYMEISGPVTPMTDKQGQDRCKSVEVRYHGGMIEQPSYTLIKKQGSFELRHYQSFTMIEASDQDLQSYRGFRLAFDFIQGDNVRNQKIAMTVPVVNNLDDQGIRTTAFVMPPKMVHEDVPLPLSPNLQKILVPERLCAVYRFGSNPRMEMIRGYEDVLRSWIAQEGYRIIGTLQLARYNPPFIPGFLKRNELWFEVERQS